MIFEINVFGAHCKSCQKPFTKTDFIYGKFYMKVRLDGSLDRSSGYIDLWHKGCAPAK